MSWKAKNGTTLILKATSQKYKAPDGARAILKNDYGDGWVAVQWIDRDKFKNHRQPNDEYPKEDFVLFEKQGDGKKTCIYCGGKLEPVLYDKQTFNICHKCEL